MNEGDPAKVAARMIVHMNATATSALSGDKKPKSKEPKKTQVGYIESLYYLPIRAFKASWPYVSYSGLSGALWIFNAFDPEYLYKIDAP